MSIAKGGREASQDVSVPPTAGLWQAIVDTPKALEIVSKGKKGPTRRLTMEQYLVTPATQTEMEHKVGKSKGSASSMIRRTLIKVFPLLPQDVQAAYGSPAQALKERTRFMNAATNARRTRAIDAGTYTGKPIGRPPGSGRRG